MTASAPRVLLVEDDAVIRSMLERGLAKAGVVVVSAETSEAAIALFGKSSFDAVITDKNLRGTASGGLDVARVIRQANPHVALVMMTLLLATPVLPQATTIQALPMRASSVAQGRWVLSQQAPLPWM